MPAYVMMTREQLAAEAEADALLRRALPSCNNVYYTEHQLSKKERLNVPIDALIDVCAAPPQCLRDELLFLADVSRLEGTPLRYLLAWINGYSQADISLATGVTQQRVSSQLRIALCRCYDMQPVSFREFSRRSIYRKPHRSTSSGLYRRCRVCSEPYLLSLGERGCCSTRCFESGRVSKRTSRN